MRGYLHHYHIRHEQFPQPSPRYHKFNISPQSGSASGKASGEAWKILRMASTFEVR
jgi:hypothetical protein